MALAVLAPRAPRRQALAAAPCRARRPAAAPSRLPRRPAVAAALSASPSPAPAGDSPAPAADPARPSLRARLLTALRTAVKRVKLSLALFAVDRVRDKQGILRLSSRFPPSVRTTFADLFTCYVEQVTLGSGGDAARAEAESVATFKGMVKAYARQLAFPYEFPSYHTAMRHPVDYYALGNQYVGNLVDWGRSVLAFPDRWGRVAAALAAGDNVVLLANHQSEADAAFIPLLTAASHPGLGERVVYVAGDRVVTDLMAKPFSMGRNLLCVHSRKRMDDDPAAKPAKMRQNMRTLKEMERLLRGGGQLLWLAPAGGRDRVRAGDGVLAPDAFDPAAVEMVRRLGAKAGGGGGSGGGNGPVTRFLPLAMATYAVMPPPASLEKALGEKREVRYTGVGLALGEEIDTTEGGAWAAGLAPGAPPEARQAALAAFVHSRVCDLYALIEPCMGTGAPFPLPPGCARPWAEPGAQPPLAAAAAR